MFFRDGILYRSDVLQVPCTAHGFSSREGGVSTLPHLASLNLTRGLGDSEENVSKNLDIFALALSGGAFSGKNTVTAHQIHSSYVRIVTEANRGEGYSRPQGDDCDGFVTDRPGVMPVVRIADCVPILLACTSGNGRPVVGAVHAGWRGTAAGIAGEVVRAMVSLGCDPGNIRAALGPHIMECCYEVGEDFVRSVEETTSPSFASRHIRERDGRFHADLTGMNLEILFEAGVRPVNTDDSGMCTCCSSDRFFSHRASRGMRGTQGAAIVIL